MAVGLRVPGSRPNPRSHGHAPVEVLARSFPDRRRSRLMTIATAHFLIRVVSRGLQVARSNEALGHAGGPICVVVGKLNPYTSGVVGIVGLRVNEKVAGGDVFPLGQIKGSRV